MTMVTTANTVTGLIVTMAFAMQGITRVPSAVCSIIASSVRVIATTRSLVVAVLVLLLLLLLVDYDCQTQHGILSLEDCRFQSGAGCPWMS